MSRRWRLPLVFIAAACAIVSACKPRIKEQPVTVRIFRDLPSPYAQQLDYRILDFQGTNPRLGNGAAVYVGDLTTPDLPAINSMDDPAVDIVVLSSPADAAKYPALTAEMGHAVNVCAAVQACPAEILALVPSKLPGERAEAANKFVQFLATRPAQPATPPQTTAPAESQPGPAKTGH